MSFRLLAVVAVALAALSGLYSQRQAIQNGWSPPAASTPRLIQFDNGSARDVGATPSITAPGGKSPLPAGALRQCVLGPQVSYTNVQCPPGHQEKPVTAAPVTVLPAAPQAKASAPALGGALRDGLDGSRDPTLRERMMDRAIDGKK